MRSVFQAKTDRYIEKRILFLMVMPRFGRLLHCILYTVKTCFQKILIIILYTENIATVNGVIRSPFKIFAHIATTSFALNVMAHRQFGLV